MLVADGTAVFRTGVANVLRRAGDFDVVEAADCDAVVASIERRCPDFALLDLELPPYGGVVVCARLAEECSARTIVWSFEPSREAVLGAIRAGATGYLSKDVSPPALVRALRGAVRGEAVLARDLASLVIETVHTLERRATAREQVAVLSAREREVLHLVACGARNKEVALSLFISELTVKRHMQNILQKLELRSRRTAAACYRLAHGDDPTVAAAALAEAAV